jgi:F0F1-type ATP synthase assembly protein I
MDPEHLKSKKKFDDFIRYSNLGFEMMIIIVLGTGAGIAIDRWFDFKFPIFTLVLMVLSVIGAIYQSIRKFL